MLRELKKNQKQKQKYFVTLCAPVPRDPTRDWARPASECFSVSCRGRGQQWLAVGTGALAAADSGGASCEPHHRTTKQTTHNWRTIIPKKFLHCCESSGAHISQPRNPAKGVRTLRDFDLEGQ